MDNGGIIDGPWIGSRVGGGGFHWTHYGFHLPFSEMGIFPPPNDRVMDRFGFFFYQLKRRIAQERRSYFPNDLSHRFSISKEKVITYNPRKNPWAIIIMNVAFATTIQDNTKYLTSENAQLRKELVSTKQEVDHLDTKNQWLSSTNICMVNLWLDIFEELKPIEDTIK